MTLRKNIFKNFTKQQNFRPDQTESICWRKVNVIQKLKFGIERVEKIAGEKEKMLLSVFSFSHNIFKSFPFECQEKSILWSRVNALPQGKI